MAVLGAGMGFLMQITMLVAQNSVEMKDMGVASSTTTLFRTLGGSFGVAIMGALFTSRVQDTMAERAGAAGLDGDGAVGAAGRGEPGEAAGRGAGGVPARGGRRYALGVPAGGGGRGGRLRGGLVRQGGPAAAGRTPAAAEAAARTAGEGAVARAWIEPATVRDPGWPRAPPGAAAPGSHRGSPVPLGAAGPDRSGAAPNLRSAARPATAGGPPRATEGDALKG